MQKKMQLVKDHFEKESQDFDNTIEKLIPYYKNMIEALVNCLPFDTNESREIIDLGCGTGTVSEAIKLAYPNSKLTCLDIAQNMLEIAQVKLAKYENTVFINNDFYKFTFDKKYDAIVSSLALHHLVTNQDKQDFYHKIYNALETGGIFINIDVVLAPYKNLQQKYMDKWKEYILKSISQKELEEKWIPKYHQEDVPISISEHFDMLTNVGFAHMDVVWKYYNFATFLAIK